MIIHQDAHQLCNRNCRMGIVELEGYLFMELPDIIVLPHILFHRFLYGGGDKEVLLLQAQLLTGVMVIVGIEHFHNISCQVFLLHSLLVIPFVKGLQLEALHRLRIPDTQRIHNTVSITHNRHIIRNGLHGLIAFLLKAVASVFIHIYIDVTAEFNLFGIFRTAQLKGIAVRQPVIRHFHLITVADFLFKHPVPVTDSAAVCGIAQSRKGIQEAGRQTAQAAVAERGIRLLILHDIDINTQILQGFLHIAVRLQVDQVISQCTAHQKFHGKIIYGFRILFLILLLGIHPVIHNSILDGIGHRLENLLLGSFLQGFTVKGLNIINHTVLE